MCELYLRARNIGLTSEPALALPLSQLLLADSLGMTAVHLNRVLKELRQTGATTLLGGSLLITDAAKLVQIAGIVVYGRLGPTKGPAADGFFRQRAG